MLGEERGGALRPRGVHRHHAGEREARVVIDGDMHAVHAELLRFGSASVVVNHVRAIDPPAAAVRDTAELLHVDVDQIPRPLTLVSDLRATRRSDANTGDRVELVQRRKAGTGDDPGGRRGANSEATRKIIATDSLITASSQ